MFIINKIRNILVVVICILSGNVIGQIDTKNNESLGKYQVKGNINGVTETWIYLAHSSNLRKNMLIDSVKIINGKFEFSGDIKGVEAVLLGLPTKDNKGNYQLKSKEYRGPILLSDGVVIVDGDYDSRRKFIAKGTSYQDEYNSYKLKQGPINNKLNQVIRDLNSIKKTETNKVDSLNKLYVQFLNQLTNVVKDQVSAYPNSETSAYIVISDLITADAKTLIELFNILNLKVQNSVYGVQLKSRYQKALKTDYGNFAPDFNLTDKNGSQISLSSFKGKYVLIDFWASWCGPCRREHPDYLKIYNDYKEKGFEIVSISMDNKKENWLKAILEDKLAWTQLSDLKAKESEVGIEYGINILPMNFLINKEGKIIARNLKAIDLKNKLAELFLEIE